MRIDKTRAIQLRKQGKSYNEIHRALRVPKSTLSDWFSHIAWSKQVKRKLAQQSIKFSRERMILMNKVREEKLEKWRQAARDEATIDYRTLKNNPLFLASIMLYWAEGDSKMENCSVRLTNTDPKMIRIFVNFLREICQTPNEKLRVYIILYPDLIEKTCKNYWSKVSGIPKNQFIKTQFIKGKHPTKRLSYGICMINVGSRQLKEKIYVWLKLFQTDLLRV